MWKWTKPAVIHRHSTFIFRLKKDTWTVPLDGFKRRPLPENGDRVRNIQTKIQQEGRTSCSLGSDTGEPDEDIHRKGDAQKQEVKPWPDKWKRKFDRKWIKDKWVNRKTEENKSKIWRWQEISPLWWNQPDLCCPLIVSPVLAKLQQASR